MRKIEILIPMITAALKTSNHSFKIDDKEKNLSAKLLYRSFIMGM